MSSPQTPGTILEFGQQGTNNKPATSTRGL